MIQARLTDIQTDRQADRQKSTSIHEDKGLDMRFDVIHIKG